MSRLSPCNGPALDVKTNNIHFAFNNTHPRYLFTSTTSLRSTYQQVLNLLSSLLTNARPRHLFVFIYITNTTTAYTSLPSFVFIYLARQNAKRMASLHLLLSMPTLNVIFIYSSGSFTDQHVCFSYMSARLSQSLNKYRKDNPQEAYPLVRSRSRFSKTSRRSLRMRENERPSSYSKVGINDIKIRLNFGHNMSILFFLGHFDIREGFPSMTIYHGHTGKTFSYIKVT